VNWINGHKKRKQIVNYSSEHYVCEYIAVEAAAILKVVKRAIRKLQAHVNVNILRRVGLEGDSKKVWGTCTELIKWVEREKVNDKFVK
jgi:hypothetical protein